MKSFLRASPRVVAGLPGAPAKGRGSVKPVPGGSRGMMLTFEVPGDQSMSCIWPGVTSRPRNGRSGLRNGSISRLGVAEVSQWDTDEPGLTGSGV